ncbi:hypothetical protein CUS_7604 [Ruminococcus albus 8]|uniref:Uncharacterized protein n=2 Tax=Ruminococcus TaxID=1263 RepID=E9SH76_RUMAL|nr:hypothetical protein CUS_7604 [Ruminococcus albus 8]
MGHRAAYGAIKRQKRRWAHCKVCCCGALMKKIAAENYGGLYVR